MFLVSDELLAEFPRFEPRPTPGKPFLLQGRTSVRRPRGAPCCTPPPGAELRAETVVASVLPHRRALCCARTRERSPRHLRVLRRGGQHVFNLRANRWSRRRSGRTTPASA